MRRREVGRYLFGDNGSLPGLGMVTTLAFLYIAGMAFCDMHEFIISVSQDLTVGPRCCSMSARMSSNPAAFPGLRFFKAASSSSTMKG